MMSKERWLLAGSCLAIALCGSAGLVAVHGRLTAPPLAFTPEPQRPLPPPQDPGKEARERLQKSLQVIHPSVKPTDHLGYLIPRIIENPKDGPDWKEFHLLPTPLYSGTVEIDRARLTWKLAPPDLKAPGIKRVASPAEAVVIHRQMDGGEIERVAVLDPKESMFEDRDVQPGRLYRYWVLVRGLEGVHSPTSKPVPVDKAGENAVEGRTPEWVKVKLIGGDAAHAILGVETYNPVKGRWESSTVQTTVGGPIGRTGWTLERLRFDRFTLLAEVRDDRFETRDLSTRKN